MGHKGKDDLLLRLDVDVEKAGHILVADGTGFQHGAAAGAGCVGSIHNNIRFAVGHDCRDQSEFFLIHRGFLLFIGSHMAGFFLQQRPQYGADAV